MGDSTMFTGKGQTPILASQTTGAAPPMIDLTTAATTATTATTAKKRCPCCSHKLHLSDMACGKCGDRYCMNHRLPELHNCGYDFKTAGQRELAAANPQVVNDKLATRI
jgi:hypothetical protein